MQMDLLVLGGGGEQCSKNSFLFSYMFNTKSSCFSPKVKLYMFEMGTKVQYAKIWTDSEQMCAG